MFNLRRKRELLADYQRTAHLAPMRRKTQNGIEERDFRTAAAQIRVPPAYLHAFYTVESGGSGFNADGRLKILYEPHIVHRHTGGRLTGRTFPWKYRGREFEIPLSYKRWQNPNRGQYPVRKPIRWHPYLEGQVGRWEMLITAYQFEEDALRGASYGAFQVLGKWAEDLDFDDPLHMVEYLYQSELHHLGVAIRYLRMVSPQGIPALQRGDWRTVARLWNGTGQVDKFSGLLEAASEKAAREFGSQGIHA